MSNSYKVIVNKTNSFVVSTKDILFTDAIKLHQNKYHVLHNNKPFRIEVLQSDFNTKHYSIQVNNTKFEIDIKDDLDQLINEMGFSLSSTKNVDFIKAPMPGLILEVNVKVGQEVKENDALLILEAMKMENIITSPRDGIIKSVTAIKGTTVEKGSLLIEFQQ